MVFIEARSNVFSFSSFHISVVNNGKLLPLFIIYAQLVEVMLCSKKVIEGIGLLTSREVGYRMKCRLVLQEMLGGGVYVLLLYFDECFYSELTKIVAPSNMKILLCTSCTKHLKCIFK